jgi:hypothetical protein
VDGMSRPSRTSRAFCTASDAPLGGAPQQPPVREVWWHKPTGHRWIVETDSSGFVVAAAGPFRPDDWDPLLLKHVPLDRRHAGYFVSDKLSQFVRQEPGAKRR